MNRVIPVILLLLMIALTGWADTLYLRDGNVLKGRFLGYENGQFIFEVDNGGERRFRPSEVLRLVLEPVTDSTEAGTAARWEVQPPLDVQLTEKWIKTGLILRRGQRVRVSASGTIVLDGKTQTGPDGIIGRRDPDAPLPDENDGALIAIIGKDENAPELLIGRQREFVAGQDGELYFTVNHWQTRNSRGAFQVEVSLDLGTAAGGEEGSSGARARTVTINANQNWTDTGIDVVPDMTLEMVAEGTIEIGDRVTSGPDGNQNGSRRRLPLPDFGPGALIARIRYRDGRYSAVVGIGAQGGARTEKNEYGRLFLGINDDYFGDNRGSYKVRVRW